MEGDPCDADTEDPSITCPANITVSNTVGQCNAVVNYTAPVGKDECPNASTMQTAGLGSGAAFPLGVTTETYVVTDASGNTESCSFTVRVNDDDDPKITCPGDLVVNSDPGKCGAIVTYAAPVFTDNCGVIALESNGFSSGDLFPVGATIVAYQAVDAADNRDECSFTVTVTDNEPPTLICKPSYTVQLDKNGSYILQDPDRTAPQDATFLRNALFTAFEDNCGVNLGAVNNNDPGALVFDCDRLGDNFITFFGLDINGNFSSCMVNIIVTDPGSTCNQAPDAICKTNEVAVRVDGDCVAMLSPEQIDNGSSDPDGDPLILSLDNEGPFNPGTYTVELTAQDDSQAEDKCTVTVVVIDDILPTAICPPDIMVQCAGLVPLPDPNLVGIEDNCDLPLGQFAFHVRDDTDEEFNPEVQDRIYAVVDIYGNEGRCTQKITIQDTTNPVIKGCPPGGTINVNENCKGEVLDYTSFLIVEDNCGPDQFLTLTQSPIKGTLVDADFDMIITAQDRSGNTSECRIPIRVVDPIPPSITCPANITVPNDAGLCGASITYTPPVGTDNCPGVSTKRIAGLGSGATFRVGTTTETYRATDAMGAISECSFTVTVRDLEAPSITCPTNQNVECLADVPDPNTDLVTATDNCGLASVTYVGDSFIGAACDRTITRTYRAIDVSGNENTCKQVITVLDDTAPLAPAPPADLTVQCADDIPAPVDLTATDNCDGAITVSPQLQIIPGSCANDFTMVRTWIFTDQCGNTSSVSQTIKVKDTTLPEFTFCPPDTEVDCNLSIPAVGNPTAVDNCDDNVSISYLGEERDNSCGSDYYLLTRTWEAEDNCGNTTQCVQVIRVNTILSDDCFNITLDLNYDASSNTTSFRWELCVADNKCQDLSNVSFSLPCDLPKSSISGTGTSVTDGLVDITGKPSNRNNCKYGITFENFAADGGIKGESDGCATFYYTLTGDYRAYETDVDIKAGKERGLGFDNIGATCDCDGSILYDVGGSYIVDADASELTDVLVNDPFKAKVASLRAYPNPARGDVTIEFNLPQTEEAVLEVFNLAGLRVARLFRDQAEAGLAYQVSLNRNDLPNGTYIYRLQTASGTFQGKLVLLD